MPILSRTTAHQLAILAVAHLAGCDHTDDPFAVDPDEELVFRDIVGNPPNPSIIEIVKRPPLYPAQYYDKGHGIPWNSPWIHSGYDPSTGGFTDPAGYTLYTFDQNGLLPFGTSDAGQYPPVCEDFLEDHSAVPIAETGDLAYCAAAEQGCCDFICKAWGAEVDPNDRVDFVDQEVMDIQPIKDTYVPEFLAWNDEDPNHNGGLGRGRACSCNCTTSQG